MHSLFDGYVPLKIRQTVSRSPGNRVSNERERQVDFLYSKTCQLRVDSCLMCIDDNQYNLNWRTPGLAKKSPRMESAIALKGHRKSQVGPP